MPICGCQVFFKCLKNVCTDQINLRATQQQEFKRHVFLDLRLHRQKSGARHKLNIYILCFFFRFPVCFLHFLTKTKYVRFSKFPVLFVHFLTKPHCAQLPHYCWSFLSVSLGLLLFKSVTVYFVFVFIFVFVFVFAFVCVFASVLKVYLCCICIQNSHGLMYPL